ncbi:unnamed protein product [Meloidogyne enterolobii]|uniref:Uncharacterized protein n=1 Tax=Meloidogyne enterolobii TaxID=390850 RepID=A0ACB0ZJH7_MELEN
MIICVEICLILSFYFPIFSIYHLKGFLSFLFFISVPDIRKFSKNFPRISKTNFLLRTMGVYFNDLFLSTPDY